ncbi:MAG: UbiA family prenyltransferase [Planctomycetota bacterium]|nr:UbiA family prenyltransferase [Planctomycetota bacterium]
MAARFSSSPVPLGLHGSSSLELLRSLGSAFGHLAAWVGFYVGGCVALAGLLLNGSVSILAVAIAIPAAMGTYLIDRARPLPGRVDPADTVAHASRAALMVRSGGLIRVGAVVLLALASVLALSMSPLAIVVVVGAPVGVLIYSHRGQHTRPKDRLIVKNAFVAVSIVTLVLVLLSHVHQSAVMAVVGGFLLLHVFADAMLCDIDDRHADARFGTRTIPNTLGVAATWRLAIMMDLMALVLLILAAWWDLLPWPPAMLLGLTTLSATVILASLPVTRVKDFVDLKLPVAVLVGWVGLSLAGGVAS